MSKLTPAAMRLVDAPNIAHLSTLMPDGWPKVEPVWIGRDGDLLLVATDAKSLKARNVTTDARVAVSVTDEDNPYEQLLMRGTVIEVRADDDLAVLDALSRKYLGEPFARRRWSARVVLVIRADIARHHVSPLRRPNRQPTSDPTTSGEQPT
jgi:PPOX class probable F420-dependent enzyme